jgi:surface antigen
VSFFLLERNMRKLSTRGVLGAAMLTLGLSGCATNPNNEDVGKFVGAVAGAGLGSLFGGGSGKTVMTVIGGIAGYAIGGNIGRNMDAADQERAARLAQYGFDQPRPSTYHDSWRSPNGAYVESRVTTQPYYQNSGRDCRPFTQETTIRIEGRPHTAVKSGVACFEYTQQSRRGMWVIQP